MKRLLVLLLAVCLALPAGAEPAGQQPESWIVPYGCLTDFLQAWSENNTDAMLTLCAPSWKTRQADAALALFLLMRNRTATAWGITESAGAGDDRLYDVTILLEDYSGQEPQWYRFTLRVVLEDGVRYVEPEGLAAGEKTEQPETYQQPEAAVPTAPEADPGSWWHEAGSWNHAGDPEVWPEHQARFLGFMEAWMNRDVDGVLTYLTPGWEPDSDDAWWTLQRRFALYVPESYTICSIAVGEDTRRVAYTISSIEETADYRLQTVVYSIELYWDSGVWYVNPDTIPEPAAA